MSDELKFEHRHFSALCLAVDQMPKYNGFEGRYKDALEIRPILRAMQREADQLRQRVGDLLAVIHRDGGHYQIEHGEEKAIEDAKSVVLTDRQRVAFLEVELQRANNGTSG